MSGFKSSCWGKRIMPTKDFMLDVQSNLDDIQVISKIINTQNASSEFKFSITKHAMNSSNDSGFQDAFFNTNEGMFAFQEEELQEEELVNCPFSEYSEKASLLSENSSLNRNICNQSANFLPNSTIENRENTPEKKITRKTEITLRTFSVKELRLLAADLAQIVNDVSNKLVSLLQGNDTLRQESDARNIAIEQLLKITVKQAETELRHVKMSVITSNDEIDDDEWD